MPHADGHHQPRDGDRIWDERRIKEGKQPNGKVYCIVEYGSDGEVIVEWFAGDVRWQTTIEVEYETVQTSELDGQWDDKTNSYRIYIDGRIV